MESVFMINKLYLEPFLKSELVYFSPKKVAKEDSSLSLGYFRDKANAKNDLPVSWEVKCIK